MIYIFFGTTFNVVIVVGILFAVIAASEKHTQKISLVS